MAKKRRSRRMEKQSKDFSEEIENIFAKKGKSRITCYVESFSVFGPLLISILKLVCLVIGIAVLSWLGTVANNSFFASLSGFFFTNLHWFFAAFLFVSYGKYIYRRYTGTYMVLFPLTVVIRVLIAIWVIAEIFGILGNFTSTGAFAALSSAVLVNLVWVFVVLLVLSYSISIFSRTIAKR